jgi:predicted S18 family serine protease
MNEFVIILLFFAVFLFAYSFLYNTNILPENKTEINYSKELQPTQEFYYNYSYVTTIDAPAVDKEGSGTIVILSVEAKPGIGRTLIDINQIFLWVDTQDSIRTAKAVAKNVTGIDLSDYDIIYSVQANASAVEGPSAGAALGIATILELENMTVNKKVTITGTLSEDGKIGKVSGIVAKAEAAKDVGMEILLVPVGEKNYTSYIEEKKCENYLITEICRTETKAEEVNIEKKVGMRFDVGDVRFSGDGLKVVADVEPLEHALHRVPARGRGQRYALAPAQPLQQHQRARPEL